MQIAHPFLFEYEEGEVDDDLDDSNYQGRLAAKRDVKLMKRFFDTHVRTAFTSVATLDLDARMRALVAQQVYIAIELFRDAQKSPGVEKSLFGFLKNGVQDELVWRSGGRVLLEDVREDNAKRTVDDFVDVEDADDDDDLNPSLPPQDISLRSRTDVVKAVLRNVRDIEFESTIEGFLSGPNLQRIVHRKPHAPIEFEFGSYAVSVMSTPPLLENLEDVGDVWCAYKEDCKGRDTTQRPGYYNAEEESEGFLGRASEKEQKHAAFEKTKDDLLDQMGLGGIMKNQNKALGSKTRGGDFISGVLSSMGLGANLKDAIWQLFGTDATAGKGGTSTKRTKSMTVDEDDEEKEVGGIASADAGLDGGSPTDSLERLQEHGAAVLGGGPSAAGALAQFDIPLASGMGAFDLAQQVAEGLTTATVGGAAAGASAAAGATNATQQSEHPKPPVLFPIGEMPMLPGENTTVRLGDNSSIGTSPKPSKSKGSFVPTTYVGGRTPPTAAGTNRSFTMAELEFHDRLVDAVLVWAKPLPFRLRHSDVATEERNTSVYFFFFVHTD